MPMDERDSSETRDERLLKKMARLSPAKQALLKSIMVGKHPGSPLRQQQSTITPIPRDGELPLSHIQEERLLHCQRMRAQSVNVTPNHISLVFRLGGALNTQALELAINEVLRRHEVLRSYFPEINGRPFAKIIPPFNHKLPLIDLRELPQPERESEALRFARKEIERPFALDSGPLLRTSLVRLGEDEHMLVGVVDHLIFDGHSTRILLRELGILYEFFRNDKPSPLPELPFQYVDFVRWQRERLQGSALEQLLSYWREKFKGSDVFPELELPIARSVSDTHTFKSERQSLSSSPALLRALTALSNQRDVSLFVLLLAALKVLLHHYTGKEGIGVITPAENRPRPEIRTLIGWFANPLNLYTDVSGNPRFSELLNRVRATTIGALEHSDLPLQSLLRLLRPEEYERVANIPGSTFGDNYVYFDKSNVKTSQAQLSVLNIRQVSVPMQVRLNSLSIGAIESDDNLKLDVMYDTGRYEATAITLFLEKFKSLLESLVVKPDQRLSDLLSALKA